MPYILDTELASNSESITQPLYYTSNTMMSYTTSKSSKYKIGRLTVSELFAWLIPYLL